MCKKIMLLAGLALSVVLVGCKPADQRKLPEPPRATEASVAEEPTTEAPETTAAAAETESVKAETHGSSSGFDGIVSGEILDMAASKGLDVDIRFTEVRDVVYAVDQLNLRIIPDEEDDEWIFKTVPKGTEMGRTGIGSGWCRIIYEGKQLYASLDYVTVEPMAASNGKVICIDPGHQGIQNRETEPLGPGSKEMKQKVSTGTAGIFSGQDEYQLNLKVSLKLRDELEKRGYTVVMTRTTHDVDISNAERAEIANEANADAFLRIHADGSTDTTAQGIMTLCPTSSNPYYAGQVYEQSHALAENVLDAMAEATGGKKRKVQETDSMTGINWSKVPVTIVEMGFMSNREEDLQLAKEDYQDKLVQGMANGIDRYMESR